MEQRVLHVHRHTPRGHLVLRNLAFDLHTFHQIGLWLKGDGANMAYVDSTFHSLIADIRHLQGDTLGFAGNHEVAILIAHATIDIVCGIFIMVWYGCGAMQ